MGETDFDYQWKNLPSPKIEYNKDRINEFLDFTNIDSQYFKNKKCLDAGAGIGRYTYALLELGANVDSIDISKEAIEKCKDINPSSKVLSIMDLPCLTTSRLNHSAEQVVLPCLATSRLNHSAEQVVLQPNPVYDFVLSWGVLHHTENPREAFKRVAAQVKKGGILHVMLYHKDTQQKYTKYRNIWNTLDNNQKLNLCLELTKNNPANVHGWWDALNPTYNYSYTENEIEKWFVEEGFVDIKLTKKYNINMNGIKS